jgi:hypothetical protein
LQGDILNPWRFVADQVKNLIKGDRATLGKYSELTVEVHTWFEKHLAECLDDRDLLIKW